jgi:hypothetical protein
MVTTAPAGLTMPSTTGMVREPLGPEMYASHEVQLEAYLQGTQSPPYPSIRGTADEDAAEGDPAATAQGTLNVAASACGRCIACGYSRPD